MHTNILVIGPDGSGKSSFINALVGGFVAPVGSKVTIPARYSLAPNGQRDNIDHISKILHKIGDFKEIADYSQFVLPFEITAMITEMPAAHEYLHTLKEYQLIFYVVAETKYNQSEIDEARINIMKASNAEMIVIYNIHYSNWNIHVKYPIVGCKLFLFAPTMICQQMGPRVYIPKMCIGSAVVTELIRNDMLAEVVADTYAKFEKKYTPRALCWDPHILDYIYNWDVYLCNQDDLIIDFVNEIQTYKDAVYKAGLFIRFTSMVLKLGIQTGDLKPIRLYNAFCDVEFGRAVFRVYNDGVEPEDIQYDMILSRFPKKYCSISCAIVCANKCERTGGEIPTYIIKSSDIAIAKRGRGSSGRDCAGLWLAMLYYMYLGGQRIDSRILGLEAQHLSYVEGFASFARLSDIEALEILNAGRPGIIYNRIQKFTNLIGSPEFQKIILEHIGGISTIHQRNAYFNILLANILLGKQSRMHLDSNIRGVVIKLSEYICMAGLQIPEIFYEYLRAATKTDIYRLFLTYNSNLQLHPDCIRALFNRVFYKEYEITTYTIGYMQFLRIHGKFDAVLEGISPIIVKNIQFRMSSGEPQDTELGAGILSIFYFDHKYPKTLKNIMSGPYKDLVH